MSEQMIPLKAVLEKIQGKIRFLKAKQAEGDEHGNFGMVNYYSGATQAAEDIERDVLALTESRG